MLYAYAIYSHSQSHCVACVRAPCMPLDRTTVRVFIVSTSAHAGRNSLRELFAELQAAVAYCAWRVLLAVCVCVGGSGRTL